MTQALLPALIESRGTIVNISSVGGRVAMATYGPYAGSKFALEAVSDASRREGAPLGVKVVVVEPGAVTTELLSQVGQRGDRVIAEMTEEQRGRYAALMHAVIAQAKARSRAAHRRRRPYASSLTRSRASGRARATPSDAARRRSYGRPGSCPTNCSTTFSRAISSRICLQPSRSADRVRPLIFQTVPPSHRMCAAAGGAGIKRRRVARGG